METPLISIIIPTYNVEPYVEQAVRSIMDQTYNNIEIIIVDDDSKDSTYKILQQLAKEDERIHLFKNEKNVKIAETLNFGIKEAKGTFIARMDGDDISLPKRLEKQYQYMIEKGLDLVGLNVMFVDENGHDIHLEEYISDEKQINTVTEFASPVPHFWIAKKEVYDQVGAYRIAPAEDYDFIFRAIEKNFKISNLPEMQYLQRVRQGNTATATGLIQRKTIRYVKMLHQQRLKNPEKRDLYTPENFAQFIKSSAFEKYMFSKASKYHFKYFTNKASSKFSSLLYMSLAILFSPKYKLEEIYYRYKIKQLKKKFSHHNQ